MKQILSLVVLFFLVQSSSAQLNKKIQLKVQMQPEATFHKNELSYNWNDSKLKATFNMGATVSVQYKINKNLFVDAGVGYISRKFNANIVLVQSKLPPPKQSFSKELNFTKSYSYKLIQLPINIGYTFLQKNNFNSSIIIGASPNFLLKAKYTVRSAKYDGIYNKNYFFGMSFAAGVSTDVLISKHIILSNALIFSFKNTFVNDGFLGGFGDDSFVLPYNYLQYSIGLKISLTK